MIEVVDLVKWHGPIEVLRGVNLAVSRGEVAAIIGPSGSGKSTFLRCLNGLETFQSGCVTLDGLRIDAGARSSDSARIHRQVCRRVGMVFQNFNLFPHRTALENVMEGPVYVLGLQGDGSRGTRTPAARPGRHVGPAACDAPRALGRSAAARRDRPCLAMEPQAILFDEPTSALDPRMTGEVLAVMTDLAADGLTMVVVTHAMQFARRVAHTVHVFGDGRVIESGPPGQVFDDPRQEATKSLLASVQAA